MTDDDRVPEAGGEQTAGAMLRAARERQGVHIAVLAAAIKVSPRKLDALEHDRYEELPDATFVRALAQTVCRALKVDAQPILARLPQIGDSGLDAAGGLNAPFRDRPVHNEPGGGSWPQRPLLWAGALLLAAAVVIGLVPTGMWSSLTGGEAVAPPPAASEPAAAVDPGASAALAAVPASDAAPVAPAAQAADADAAASAAVAAGERPAAGEAEASATGAADASSGPAITTSADSWIQAVDADGQVLLSRVVPKGETLRLQGTLPIRLTVGNAVATEVVHRGKAVDLAPSTRNNIARLELK